MEMAGRELVRREEGRRHSDGMREFCCAFLRAAMAMYGGSFSFGGDILKAIMVQLSCVDRRRRKVGCLVEAHIQIEYSGEAGEPRHPNVRGAVPRATFVASHA